MSAEIELLAATPEELDNLRIQLASAETFQRYDLDRPLFLTRLQFEIVRSGRSDGNFVRVTSAEPVIEPYITFLVEAAWSRGRLLREYTLLLDPPTFAPPPSTQATQPVTAPTRQAPADSGEIRRPAPTPEPEQAPPPRQAVQPPVQTPPPVSEPVERVEPAERAEPPASAEPVQAEPVVEEPPVREAPAETPDTFGQPDFDATPGGDLVVVRGDTLWGITQRVRPDSRLSINQTMLAIFEANPEAFGGNINVLRAGATLRIPSADDIFRISRRDAFQEVQRQNNDWRGGASLPAPRVSPTPTAEPVDTSPTLTLVPPDEEDELSQPDTSIDTGAETVAEPSPVDEFVDPVEERIRELERILEDQDALIEIPDTELAALRNELAQLRGEPLPAEEPPVEDIQVEDETAVADEGPTAEPVVQPPAAVVTPGASEEGLLDKAKGFVTSFWFIIGAALVIAVLVLIWFMRRAGGDDDEDVTGVWDALDADEMEARSAASTEQLSALAADDDAIVVVESQQAPSLDDFEDEDEGGDTVLRPVARQPDETMDLSADEASAMEPAVDPLADTGTNKSLEDTFSSETAINLDQSDPVAEADFHMAYGLYDQAADLVNGALAADPKRQDLLAKLCEIYFVWGNRDGFVDAATRLKAEVGSDADAEWDKIVIMGQQIAGDHEMFTGVSAEGVTRAVDLSLGDGSEAAGALDIDFASEAGDEAVDIFDLGADNDQVATDETGQVSIPPDTGAGIDFELGDDDEPVVEAEEEPELHTATGTGIDFDLGADEPETEESATREMAEPGAESPTTEAPTIEEQFAAEATGVLPALGEDESDLDTASAEATAEIDLDDLDLDLKSLEETGVATDMTDESALDDIVDLDDLEATAESPALAEEDRDDLATTGKNPEVEDVDMLAVSATREMPMTGETLDETDTEFSVEDFDSLAETGTSEAADDSLAATGRNPEIDLDDLEATGTSEALDDSLLGATSAMPSLDEDEATGLMPALGDEDDEATGLMPALGDEDDEATGLMPKIGDDEATELASLDDLEDTDVGMDTSLLDATGHTQILSEDMAVEPAGKSGADDDATMLASDYGDDDDDDGEFDFAKTEALPKDIFSPDVSTDETGNMQGLAGSTDLDLDLDDLTAALKVSEVGDTVNTLRDDATVEQPRIHPDDDDDTGETGITQALSPDDFTGDLHDARTMTEVGTKLDLARAYVDMGDPDGARSILEEVLDEGDAAQQQQAQKLLDSLPA